MIQSDNPFNLTSDPFVDSGIAALCVLENKNSINEIEIDKLKDIINNISELYITDKWKKQCHGMLFPNHGKMFNPSLSKDPNKRKEKIRHYLDELLNGISQFNDYGNCIACGRRNSSRQINKSEFPLLGSGSFLNCFSYATDGVNICDTCLFCTQFLPVASQKVGGRILLLHSNKFKIMKYWVHDAVRNAQNQLYLNTITGLYVPENFTNPQNAIFELLSKIILEYEENWYEMNPSITFYYFTNYNQNPDLEIIHFPDDVFRFLAQIKTSHFFNEWKTVVRKGYIYVKKEDMDQEEKYKNKRNQVYLHLLKNENILRYFIDFKEKKILGPWGLVELYLMEVRKMEKERIEAIKKLGDKISEYIEKTDDTKRINQLETAKNYTSLRNIFRFIERKMISVGYEEPLFTFDEYVNLLFPEGSWWKETLDLLLFRIYENLHQYLVDKKVISVEEEPELTEVN
jgi:CRISPR-associated protein Cst1